MKILGIETATTLCGVGIAEDEGFVVDYRLFRGYIHAERVPGAVERVLEDSELRTAELDAIAVSIGPGSFTGLRIGLGVAKGLALGLDKPLVAVPTMEGLLSQVGGVCPRACVMLVARKGEVYQGTFRWGQKGWEMEGRYEIVREANVGEGFSEDAVLFLGEGATCYREIIQERVRGALFLPPLYSLPSGYGVAAKGMDYFRRGEIAEVDTLVPLYLKRFQGVA